MSLWRLFQSRVVLKKTKKNSGFYRIFLTRSFWCKFGTICQKMGEIGKIFWLNYVALGKRSTKSSEKTGIRPLLGFSISSKALTILWSILISSITKIFLRTLLISCLSSYGPFLNSINKPTNFHNRPSCLICIRPLRIISNWRMFIKNSMRGT